MTLKYRSRSNSECRRSKVTAHYMPIGFPHDNLNSIEWITDRVKRGHPCPMGHVKFLVFGMHSWLAKTQIIFLPYHSNLKH